MNNFNQAQVSVLVNCKSLIKNVITNIIQTEL